MITEKNALELLKKYALSPQRIDHCIGVAEFAFDLAIRIHKNHPDLPIDPFKIKRAGLLHDIGRCQPGDHELNTLSILKQEGLNDIAAITIHGSIYEIMLLRGVDNPELLPKSIENKIVAYADSRFNYRLVTQQERWKEIESRRKDETEKISSLRMSKKRFIEMEKEIESLCNKL